MKPTRIFDLLDNYKEKFIKEDAICGKQDGKWIKYSSQQYVENSYNISYGLLTLGIKKGDIIATLTNNRPEWNFIDMGMLMIGAVHLPIFTSLNINEYKHIFAHSEAKAVVVASKSIYQKIEPALNKEYIGDNIFSFDKAENIRSWTEILELGKKNASKYKLEVEKIKASITTEDFASLLYTSGTTGSPKGVMLSHKNLVGNARAASSVFGMTINDRFLSVLPISHVGGRMGNYQTQYNGTSIYYAENMGALAANMREIKPQGFGTVPRILEKIYDTIISKGKKLTGIKKSIFFWAVELGLNYDIDNGWFYKQKLKIADKLIFSKWRAVLGGNIKFAGCGGAALQPRLEKIFWAAGIKVVNMYGLTETSPIMTINRLNKPDVKLGTIGPVIDGVEIKFAEDGEILCKGHNVMLGYFKNPEQTKEVLDEEGWLRTGDIGFLEDDKFLRVTDRKKEIFKLSNGKYVAPQIIENKLKESFFIEQSMIVGEHQKFAGAIIVPSFSYLKSWCDENNISYKDKTELITLPEVKKVINDEIKKFNLEFNPHEKINRFKLVIDEWTSETGELTYTLKLKRKYIAEKYEKLISELFPKQSI